MLQGVHKTVTFEGHHRGTAEAGTPYSGSGNVPLNPDGSSAAGSAAGAHHTLLRVGSRSTIEALMVPPASDAATLRRQVESLQLDLEAHIESEQRLQAINQQLRERFELYVKQNHENVERAEAEFNTLHEDMEQTLDLQHRLAQRSAALEKEKKELEYALNSKMHEFEDERSLLRHQIERMSEDLLARTNAQVQAQALQAELEATVATKEKLEVDLKNRMDEAELLRYKVEKLNSDLCKLIDKQRRDQTLEKSHDMSLLRRLFRGFWEAIRHQQLLDAQICSASSFAKQNCCRRGLNCLQMAALRSKQLRLGYVKHAQACLKRCFDAWKVYHVASKKYKQAVLCRQKARISQMFADWRYMIEVGRLSECEENRLMILSWRFWSMSLKRRTWKDWTRWIRFWAKPLKNKLKSVLGHLETLLCRQAFASWKCFVRTGKMKRLRMNQACVHIRMRCQKWAFYRWRETIMLKLRRKLEALKGSQFRRSQLCCKALKSWSCHVQSKQQSHISKAVAFRHYVSALQAKAMAWWKSGVKQQQAAARALQEVNQALMRAALILWRDYHAIASRKKKRIKMAIVFRERRQRKVAKAMLLFWWEEMTWKRTNAHFMRILASRRRQTLRSNALHSWMHFTFESLQTANAKLQVDLLEAKTQHEAQKSQTTAVDVENLQLIDRLHAMSSDIAHLKISICEKGKQEEDLQQSLEDTAVVQSSMTAELEQQRLQIEELELESIRLQKKLEVQDAEDCVGEAQHAMHVEGLEKAMKSLQAQIDEKSNQIESYAKALKDTAEKLEGTSDESQEQLSNAFEIAGSLRKLLEDRENQFATLEGNCRRRELELGEVQRKLAAANTAFSDTLETRDAWIRELESVLTQKQNEVEEAQQEMQDLQIALDAKESLVRKLEYEMKLRSDRDSSRTKSFVSSLSSWASAAGQLDAFSGFQTNTHSIQMESMKHVYMQTKSALQQGMSPDHCVSGYRLSAFKVQTKPSPSVWRLHGGGSSAPSYHEDKKSALLALHPVDKDAGISKGFANNNNQPEDAPNQHMGKKKPIGMQRTNLRNPPVQDRVGLSHAIESSSSASVGQQTPFSITKPLFQEESTFASFSNGLANKSDETAVHEGAKKQSRSSHVKLFLEPVDSLHVEIQQLQARILERIKASATSNMARAQSFSPETS